MEFKFQSIKERSSTYFSPSSSSNFSLAATEIERRNETMLREIEKERIRAQIIGEEIMRRRILEEEVRREMMMETDFGFRFGGSTRLEQSRVPFFSSFRGGDRFRFLNHGEGFETVPFQRGGGVSDGIHQGLSLREVKNPALEVNKDKVIILAKPNVNSSELKRKATPPNGAALEPSSSSVAAKKQKTNSDWSCALCHITATSEQGLTDHLKGKKHKSRERGSGSQTMGLGASPSPKKAIAVASKPIKVPEIATASSSEKKNGKSVVKLSLKEVEENPIQKAEGTENPIFQKHHSVEKSANPNKIKFWCEVCKIGVHTKKVMNCHTRGKKHKAKVEYLNKPINPVSVKKSADISDKENKESDGGSQVKKQEIVAEEAESKEVRADSDMPTTENKGKVLENFNVDLMEEHDNGKVSENVNGDVMAEHDSGKVSASNDAADC